ncbi:TIGR03759 family integrating conjugative element protein [Pasteurella skyensis]|uniref:TIGR03759 family integrating conjugative element protein n=1 Tax=Phocoenobacter skyensis TaxID=97481 RepID=UPI0027592D0E|nr:TIGR03759 family integrating conjugative element protein [Pasteurella skyensis]MDP8189080.1 TIGR03759 family integrating conjugative element protein [Pasteurella skyensis]
MHTVNIPSKVLLLASLINFAPNIWANNSQTTTSIIQAQSIQQLAESKLKSSESLQNKDEWSEWGLTHEDWIHYKKLKEGPIGIWTPNLDPLTTLGIEAKTESERRRFAELLAKVEYARAEKILAFQLAYDKAFARLYPNQLPFRTNESGTIHSTSSAIDRVIYFTRSDCGKKCSDDLLRLIDFAKSYPIDIYLIDSKQKDETIRKWAIDNKIDIQKVRSRQITLNHDKGYWLKYAKGKMPAAFQIQGDGEWKSLVY